MDGHLFRDVVRAQPDSPRKDPDHQRGDPGEGRREGPAPAGDRRERDEERNRERRALDLGRGDAGGEHGRQRERSEPPVLEPGGGAQARACEEGGERYVRLGTGQLVGDRRREDDGQQSGVEHGPPSAEPGDDLDGRAAEGDEREPRLQVEQARLVPGEAEGRRLDRGQQQRIVGVAKVVGAEPPGVEAVHRSQRVRLRRPERPGVEGPERLVPQVGGEQEQHRPAHDDRGQGDRQRKGRPHARTNRRQRPGSEHGADQQDLPECERRSEDVGELRDHAEGGESGQVGDAQRATCPAGAAPPAAEPRHADTRCEKARVREHQLGEVRDHLSTRATRTAG